MKPERMQEELAKIDGWIRHSNKLSGAVWYEKGAVVCKFNELPPYLRSHDALQPIIEGMGVITGDKFAYILGGLVKAQVINMEARNWYLIIKATPEQKAEAILRAVGKWEQECTT